MKTFNITNRISAQAKSALERIISTHDKYRNSYFFTPDGTASGRRNNERRFAENNPDVTFIQGDKKIEVSMRYEESCRNVYYTLYVMVDGEKKNISVIKNILKK